MLQLLLLVGVLHLLVGVVIGETLCNPDLLDSLVNKCAQVLLIRTVTLRWRSLGQVEWQDRLQMSLVHSIITVAMTDLEILHLKPISNPRTIKLIILDTLVSVVAENE